MFDYLSDENPHVRHLLQSAKNLTKLGFWVTHLEQIYPSYILAAAELPFLVDIQIVVSSTASLIGIVKPFFTPPDGRFKPLRHLLVRSAHAQDISRAVSSIARHSSLSSLTIDIKCPYIDDNPLRLLNALESVVEQPAVRSLSEIHLQWHSYKFKARENPFPHHLQPLYSLRNLTCVTVDPLESIDLDDEDVARMSEAWPQIEVLQLFKDNVRWPFVSTHFSYASRNSTRRLFRVTYTGIAQLLRSCQCLRKLWIPFDISATHVDPREKWTTDSRASPLQELHVGYSPCFPGNVESLAKFLRALAPALERLIATRKAKVKDNAIEVRPELHWKQVAERISVQFEEVEQTAL
jgi:hypothetical protein